MVSVERVLHGLAMLVIKNIIKDKWHRDFISNVQRHVDFGSTLSTNQGAIILKVARNNIDALSKELNCPQSVVMQAIDFPEYNKVPYQSVSIKREVRYLGMDKLAFRFKLDPLVVSEIKALRSKFDPVNCAPRWDNKYRLWIITVTPDNLDSVFSIITQHKFDFDEPVLEYMTLCSNSKKAISTFAAVVDEGVVVANICSNPLLSYVVKNVWMGESV